MNLFECPVVYIEEYYREKKCEIDLKCEKAILLSEDDKEKADLNILRLELLDHIENAKKKVFDRYYLLDQEISESNSEKIKDEIFQDNYCILSDVYECCRLFEFKFGVLIFSQYDDFKLKDFKYFKFY